jgi:hypothetical protein
MKKLLAIPAYIWAIACALLLPITFMGNDFFAQKLSLLPFMKVNPKYTGGTAARHYTQGGLTTTINKPVFAALVGQSAKGFVQVTFSGAKPLPGTIGSTIDYNNDGKPDFRLRVNTLSGDTQLSPLSTEVLALNVSSKVKDYWVVRVDIRNLDKR